MTATPILETLAFEFSVSPDHVRNALEMIDAGLSAPFIGRFRRGQVNALSESMLRRLERRRVELEELDRRRGTILRLLEKEPNVSPAALAEIQRCMDRFELEDLFVPHRRPEPEVQLAIDRGLAQLADLLVAPVPKSERAPAPAGSDDEAETPVGAPVAGAADVSSAPQAVEPMTAAGESHEESEPYSGVESVVHETPAEAPANESSAPDATESDAGESDEGDDSDEKSAQPAPTLDAPAPSHPHVDLKTAMNAQLARLCGEFVRPERGIHTESEALAGALRILSDRLGRNARLRAQIRNMLRKEGVLAVRPTVDEGRLGRHRSLLKVRQPLRQVQGHRLLAIRQAQKDRVVNTSITLDPARAHSKVRAALGRHTHPAHAEVLDEIAHQALVYRLLPMVEQDVRLELKERGDFEALRFLSQHLRQVLMAPVLPPQPVVGVDVNAKGDWTLVVLDPNGEPTGPETRIETRKEGGDKTAEELGAELVAVLGPASAHFVALGNGKGPRAAAIKLRAALRAAKSGAWVMLVNEAGLSSYANSEIARQELPDRPVPVRMAISIGRRLQDPLEEILKVDPRHLGLGVEQGLVSKANARRVFVETIESCTSHVGCNVNRAPLVLLQNLPGLDREAAKRIVARRVEKPFASREELRADGVLTEAQWTSTAAFLRVYESTELLDGSNLHPEQYALVRRLLESAGSSVEQGFGRPGSTKGLRRVDFDVDEYTWRDLMREIAFPGRDPRPRHFGPTLLDPDTDPIRLTKDRVVEGILTNVATFGAFVDVGLPQDAMIHISEISDRYVRDAREHLSIGQVVRARILEAGGARMSLSLKNVPAPAREGGEFERGPRRGPRGRPADGGAPGEGSGDARPRREGRGRGGPGRDGDRGGRRGRDRGEREPAPLANVRAAQTRRDGLGTRSSGGRGGRSGGGGSGGPGRREGGGERRGDFGDRGDREDFVRLSELSPKNKPAHNPFANFFKEKKDGE